MVVALLKIEKVVSNTAMCILPKDTIKACRSYDRPF